MSMFVSLPPDALRVVLREPSTLRPHSERVTNALTAVWVSNFSLASVLDGVLQQQTPVRELPRDERSHEHTQEVDGGGQRLFVFVLTHQVPLQEKSNINFFIDD